MSRPFCAPPGREWPNIAVICYTPGREWPCGIWMLTRPETLAQCVGRPPGRATNPHLFRVSDS